MGETRIAYRILLENGRTEKKEERGLQKKKKKDMNLRYIESLMDLAQNGVQVWASLLAVLNLMFLLSDS